MSNIDPDNSVPGVSFWQNRHVQTILPFATSLLFHVAIISTGALVWKIVPTIRSVTMDQIVIPDTELVENADNGGVPNPGISGDPTRAAAQNEDESVSSSPDWANKKSDTLTANLVSGSADVQQNITPIGSGANVGGAISGLDTRGVGEASGNLSPFGPAGGGAGQGKGMFGIPGGNVKSVVYVSDASGSMLGTMQLLLTNELKNAIDRLRVSQAFNVIFFRDNEPGLIQKHELLVASPANKQKAYEFLEKFQIGGQTNPIPALEAAFLMKPKPELIFLLTDGRLDEPEKVVATINRLNADRKVRINTILFVDRVVDEDESKTLEEIANTNGGKFKLVRAADLLQ